MCYEFLRYWAQSPLPFPFPQSSGDICRGRRLDIRCWSLRCGSIALFFGFCRETLEERSSQCRQARRGRIGACLHWDRDTRCQRPRSLHSSSSVPVPESPQKSSNSPFSQSWLCFPFTAEGNIGLGTDARIGAERIAVGSRTKAVMAGSGDGVLWFSDCYAE